MAAPFPFAAVVKIPGEETPIERATDAVEPVISRTRSLAGPGTTPYGNCPLICPGETNASGIGMSFKRTETPPSALGKGRFDAAMVEVDSPVPNILISVPGAKGPTMKVAAFTMPLMVGAA